MILTYNFKGNKIDLVNTNVDHEQNIFTILVGKNGTGKSRLLSEIIGSLIVDQKAIFFVDGNPYYDLYQAGINLYRAPKKLIAVSTSPFDRFPLTRFRKVVKGYSYLGIRDLQSANFGLSYMSKIIGSLVGSVDRNKDVIKEIASILKYLGYTDRIVIKLISRSNRAFFEDILKAKDPILEFEEILNKSRSTSFGLQRRMFENEDGSLSKRKITRLVKIASQINLYKNGSLKSEIEISASGMQYYGPLEQNYEDLLCLLQIGFLRLQDVVLEKFNHRPYSIREASSGEQTVIISILGIVSQIEERSLVCIDEPELCLHPEWQEKYIRILVGAFKNFRNCHFIIATHSPQIVSNLPLRNSYILNMEDGKLRNARNIVNHSADFQLANIFNAPGYKNEYLNRIALTIFSKVSKLKTFDEKDLDDYEILKAQYPYISAKDPLAHLIVALKEMYSLYA